MEKKITIAKALETAIELAIEAGYERESELVQKYETMLAQNAKRSTKSGEPTEKQKQNRETAEVVYNYLLTQAEPLTIGEIIKGCEGMGGLSSSKMTAIVKILVTEGRVVKETNKRGRGVYSVA